DPPHLDRGARRQCHRRRLLACGRLWSDRAERNRHPRVGRRRMSVGPFLARSVHEVAPALIGWTLRVDGVGGTVVEVAAYREDDPASHSYGGPRGRNLVMFGPPGRLYVYRSYGIHWCANIVCEPEGAGAAVLLRALEPTHGLEEMRVRRGLDDTRLLCSGP